jgi:hypothetical protein
VYAHLSGNLLVLRHRTLYARLLVVSVAGSIARLLLLALLDSATIGTNGGERNTYFRSPVACFMICRFLRFAVRVQTCLQNAAVIGGGVCNTSGYPYIDEAGVYLVLRWASPQPERVVVSAITWLCIHSSIAQHSEETTPGSSHFGKFNCDEEKTKRVQWTM